MELKLLSRYRDQLFGISILSIIIFHFTEDYANAYKAHLVSFNLPVIGYYKAIGSIGVEVFMFLSGMGLYYAMRKGPSLGMFYKKRAIRLITYIPVGICLWGMWDFWLYEKGFVEFLKDFTFITLWTDGQKGMWFIGAIIILYAVYPFLHKILQKKYALWAVVIISVAIIVGCVYLKSLWPEIYSNTEIAVTRVPVFLWGALAGKYMAEYNAKISFPIAWIVIAAGIGLKLWDIFADFPGPFNRVVSSVYALSLMFLACIIMDALKNINLMNRLYALLATVGSYSLELYMTHVAMRKVLKVMGVETYRLGVYCTFIVFSVIVSVILNKCAEKYSQKRTFVVE